MGRSNDRGWVCSRRKYMAGEQGSELASLISRNEQTVLPEWMELQKAGGILNTGRITEGELQSQSRNFLGLLKDAAGRGGGDVGNAAYEPVRTMLAELSRSRAQQGFSPTETATFVFSLKQPLFNRLRSEFGQDAQGLADEVWVATSLLDKLGLLTIETYVKGREEV